jgi:crotonobetainyl-CoA:carnitine CoA-transferase CaiB-like acyl-CoA transferase
MSRGRKSALSIYRVLDLTNSSVAYCAKLLADLGADVIKVEGPEGDPGRRIAPFAGDSPHIEKSLYFLHRNANKRGITLDLSTPGGRDALKRLVEITDVLVENSPPGYMEGLDLGYPVLRKINPKLIMASLTEFGQSGPYRDYKSSNLVDYALSGAMISSGYPNQLPCMMPGTPGYDSASVIGAISILATLYSCAYTGRGQYIDVSVHEASRVCLHPWALPFYSYAISPDNPKPVTDMRLGPLTYPIYPCKDGFIRVAALTPRQWDGLVRLLGNPEVLLSPEWSNFYYRVGNADDLYAIMTDLTTKYSGLELFEAGHREGIPIAIVLNIEDFVENPQTTARKFFVKVNHPIAGKAFYPGPPYKWSLTQANICRPAPLLGEHNEEVLQQSRTSPGVKQTVKGGSNQPLRLPLEGIRVLSFSTGAAGPDCGKVLGELGADVIKIECKDNLDQVRTIVADPNNSAGFNESNRNTRSFGLNLTTKKGIEIAKRLIKMSDIIIENFRGGVMKGFGLDYERVRRIHPEIIYLSSQGYGSDGPYSDFQAYGPMLCAASGILSIWSHPDDPYPVGSSAPYPDHIASKHLVVAALAALDYRRRTGEGQFIEMAQTEVIANLIGEYFLQYTVNKQIPNPLGNRSPYNAPQGIYSCKDFDSWVAITVFNDEEWLRLCQAMGNPSWAHDSKFANNQGRLDNVEELDKLLGEWTAMHDAHEVMETIQRAGVAAGIVQKAPDAIEDPQLKHLGAIVELDHAVAGKRLYPAIPFKLSATPSLKSTRAPLLGEHTEEICHKFLEMSKEEITSLMEDGVLEGQVSQISNK